MKLYVVSDTHGNRFNIDVFLKQAVDADCIAHLGDVTTDAKYIAAKVECPVIWVRGNCDFGLEPQELIKDIAGIKVLITHGHLLSVKSDIFRLLYRAQEAQAKIALFGHTHISMIEYIDGIYFVNPGSLSRPINSESPTFACIDIEGSVIKPQIYSLYHKNKE